MTTAQFLIIALIAGPAIFGAGRTWEKDHGTVSTWDNLLGCLNMAVIYAVVTLVVLAVVGGIVAGIAVALGADY